MAKQGTHSWTPIQRGHIQEVEAGESWCFTGLEANKGCQGQEEKPLWIYYQEIQAAEWGNLVTVDIIEKAEVLSVFFVVICTSQAFVPRDKFQGERNRR